MEEDQTTVRGTVVPTTGFCESFNSKRRDGLLDGEIFYSLAEAKVVIESWRQHCNTKRPHSSLGYRPPAPQVVQWPASPSGAASPATPAVATKPVMKTEPGPPYWGRPAAIVAVAVSTEGRREIVGLHIGPSEAEPFWTTLPRAT